MPKKKYLEKIDKLDSFGKYFFEDSLDHVIGALKGFRAQYESQGYRDIYIEGDIEYGYYNDHYDKFVLYGKRDETDAERDKRLAKRKKYREKKKK